MKNYTDLEQSKRLAEILPLESADKHWIILDGAILRATVYDYFDLQEYNQDKGTLREYIPCWSLAALLGVLPRSIEFKGDKYYLRFMKEYVEYANDEVSITGRCLHTTGNDNLVDACYEMIVKLNKLNLLDYDKKKTQEPILL